MKKTWLIIQESLPILAMVLLIPLITNDYWLTLIYIVIIMVSFTLKKLPHEITTFLLGFGTMIIMEALFVSTGVETFIRRSLFGLMPVWLPFLWGYGYVVIKRAVNILERNAS